MEKAFWDSSALIPICVAKQVSATIESLDQRYEIVVWWGTPVEMRGAIARLLKVGALSPREHLQAWFVWTSCGGRGRRWSRPSGCEIVPSHSLNGLG